MYTLFFGGSFDPVHLGHILTARAAREILHADRVVFLPANISPHKQSTCASNDHRLAMLQRAIIADTLFLVDDFELTRTGPSYTIHTVLALRPRYAPLPDDKITLLLGADQLARLHTWLRITELLSLVDLAVLGRIGESGPTLDHDLDIVARYLGQPIRARLAAALLPTPLVPASSTDLRHRIQSGLPTVGLLDPAVAAYIRNHNLYA